MAEKEKRLVQHNFKTTESEARIIRKKMEALGITNESAYMRALALNGYILKLDLPQIREMIRLLSNMTNNLNQIARRLNAQGQMYDTEMEEMLQKQDELWQMMRKLLSSLEIGYGQNGIAFLVLALLASPVGLPAIAHLLLNQMDRILGFVEGLLY